MSGVYCCVHGCTSHGRKKDQGRLSYFRIPAVVSREGKETEELTRTRRLAWIKAINRKGLTMTEADKKPWLRVCSAHFHGGKPAYKELRNHPDWAPSLNLGYTTGTGTDTSTNTSSYDRLMNRKRKRQDNDNQPNKEIRIEQSDTTSSADLHPLAEDGDTDRDENRNTCDKATNTDMTMSYINALESDVNRLSSDLINVKSAMKKFCFDDNFFRDNDEKVKSYTGIPTFLLLSKIVSFLSPLLLVRCNLSQFQQVIIVLFKLKLNIPFQVLGDMFHISKSTACKTFLDTLDIMHMNLRQLIVWPDRESLRNTMPKEFIKTYGRKVTVIIDCFEIFIEKPSSVKAQAETFSSYKHHNTIKYLLGITPQATVSFLSNGWGGRTSDKHLTENCGFLDKLQHGDLILADRGFDISDSVALRHAEIKIPAFTRGKKQLPASDIERTRKLAHLRIHVERVIGSARTKFSILQGNVPIKFLQSRTKDDCVPLDKIVTVCFSILNLCPSLVKNNK